MESHRSRPIFKVFYSFPKIQKPKSLTRTRRSRAKVKFVAPKVHFEEGRVSDLTNSKIVENLLNMVNVYSQGKEEVQYMASTKKRSFSFNSKKSLDCGISERNGNSNSNEEEYSVSIALYQDNTNNESQSGSTTESMLN